MFTERTTIKLPGHIEFTLILISKDAFLELDTTQTHIRSYVMCCVQFEEEMNTYCKWQSSLKQMPISFHVQ